MGKILRNKKIKEEIEYISANYKKIKNEFINKFKNIKHPIELLKHSKIDNSDSIFYKMDVFVSNSIYSEHSLERHKWKLQQKLFNLYNEIIWYKFNIKFIDIRQYGVYFSKNFAETI